MPSLLVQRFIPGSLWSRPRQRGPHIPPPKTLIGTFSHNTLLLPL